MRQQVKSYRGEESADIRRRTVVRHLTATQ